MFVWGDLCGFSWRLKFSRDNATKFMVMVSWGRKSSSNENHSIINSFAQCRKIRTARDNSSKWILDLISVSCLFQEILSEERLTFKFLDVVTILLNYCGPKLVESENKEMKAVIRDLIIIIGYFCANNRRNQVSRFCSLWWFH